MAKPLLITVFSATSDELGEPARNPLSLCNSVVFISSELSQAKALYWEMIGNGSVLILQKIRIIENGSVHSAANAEVELD